ncbi:hypothetical protein JAAARDRAFT_188210 [Jaapia argillacea MUCL 33604]|uniref:Uncharacterized protein n=1 Tax=Jaapia argillacea MUCL 33604 TaxID=933084 RepID=A0A067QDD3_9AGAM|nr:hypothetical protein JAAARDRAFT_188210 [Jaapia argillacea MUCL 33604]
MKALRNSLKGNHTKDHHHNISTPIPLPALSKPPSTLIPPKKVIRATGSYRPQAPQELPFQTGDFFYVIKDEQKSAWFQAHNPVTGARGLVPKSMFEEFNKSNTDAQPPISPQSGRMSPGPMIPLATSGQRQPKPKVFYAVVVHDFVAERADELDAKAGDSISVVAQSNREWFVAKPIGKLGRPGLIPVSFVEVRDPTTNLPIEDVGAIIDRGELPRVEEWKKQMLNYKANSIALGVIEDNSARGQVPNSPYTSMYSPTSPQLEQPPVQLPPQPAPVVYEPEPNVPDRPPTPSLLPPGILLTADVVSFHHEMEEYWFRINAIYQPCDPSTSLSSLPSAKQLVLFRAYNDFFDFQVELLKTFPREAGREPPHPRILPYMPGPVDQVDDAITAQRRHELDAYLHSLCSLLQTNAQYILEHRVVAEFLSIKPGDVETSIDPRVEEMKTLRAGHGREEHLDPVAEIEDDYSVEAQLNGMKLADEDDDGSDGSVYEEDTQKVQGQGHDRNNDHTERHPYAYDPSPPRPSPGPDYLHNSRDRRSDSTSSSKQSPVTRTDSAYHSRENSPLPHQQSYQASQTSQLRNMATRDADHHRTSSHSNFSSGSGSKRQEAVGASLPSPTSLRSSQAPSTRSRSHSNAANLNTPPISSTNPQTAFVKIKIFDRVSDDLIAIRVHPRVTYAQLMDKVHGRLGGNVLKLKYRDSLSNEFVGLGRDDELREWIEKTDKHVLYAD